MEALEGILSEVSPTGTMSQNDICKEILDSWLSVKLKSLDTDENVFGAYIRGILEGEETEDEKMEALEGILSEVSPTGTMSQNDICKEILEKWEKFMIAAKEEESQETVSVDIQIARIMEQQALCVVPSRKPTEEAKKLKQSILTLYAQVSDEEEDGDVNEGAGGADPGEDKMLGRNTNAEDVMKAERLKKEVLRQETQKKKEKDKEDREKQKQQALDRKEKEKKRTQKGEKKR
nr:EOG090X0H15 [Polyphemus pediculus]